MQFYFNTSYDRRSYEAGRLDIVKLPSGSYRVQGIEYPKKTQVLIKAELRKLLLVA